MMRSKKLGKMMKLKAIDASVNSPGGSAVGFDNYLSAKLENYQRV